jgi:hypothetical protein
MAKGNKQQERGDKNRKRNLTSEMPCIEDYKWPPFLGQSDVRLLIQRIEETAVSEYELKSFMTIVKHAYQDALELEILYHELPKLFIGDLGCRGSSNFREILNRAAGSMAGSESILRKTGSITSSIVSVVDNVVTARNFECAPEILIKPSIVLLILLGIERIVFGNKDDLDRYTNVVVTLWNKTHYLERLYRKALQRIEDNGRDPLRDYLVIIARDCNIPVSFRWGTK